MKKKSEAFEKQNLAILVLLLVFFILTLSLYFVFKISLLDYSKPNINSSEIIVSEIIDGDTFKLSSGETVRLICVDAPEKNKKGYEEAKVFLSDLILNKQVRLEKDISDKDSYGRLLRYVYVEMPSLGCSFEPSTLGELSDETCVGISTNEVFVNKEIVKNNYGILFSYGNDTKRCSEIAD
ncbi:MAG: thermonuclease family protein [Candidatus Pacearchaeota archaeon]|jgi:hypothetical protein